MTGKPYQGDRRTCYIPDIPEGNVVLALLVKAFQRKLTFTIGFSVVRNRDGVIVWNGIHHKTNTRGGSANYGWPEPAWFENCTKELKLKGVTLENQ